MKQAKVMWHFRRNLTKYFPSSNSHKMNYFGKPQHLSFSLPIQSVKGISQTSVDASSEKKVESKFDSLDTTFSDSEAAYKNKTTGEIFRALIVFQLFSVNFLVAHNIKIMKWLKSILGNQGFSKLMKMTVYGHFVGGEDEEKLVPTLVKLNSFGVKSIVDYSVEEDISHEDAEKLEMDATQSEVEKKGKPSEVYEIGGQMPQYHAHKEFADRRYKVSSARTYFYLNEPSCERNVEIFQRCLETVAKSTQCTGFTAIKLTALGRPQLLLQLSEVIMRARNFVNAIMGGNGAVLAHHFSAEMLETKLRESGITDTTKFLQNVVTDKEGVIHLFPWSGIIDENFELSETFRVPNLKEGRMVRLISELSTQEEAMFRNMIRRVNTLVKTAKDLNVRLMIDAEQTYFQPAISRICLEMMNKYNKEKGIVYNTYQCYLKDTYNEVCSDLEQAKRQNFYFGAKLVRGAYIEQERERAQALNYPDPTNPSYEATSAMYHQTLTECLRQIKSFKDSGEQINKVAIMVASHNEDTIRFAIDKMKELGLPRQDRVLCFGQLYGMCDYITFPLGQAGYSAFKYVPYGPVHEVLPYLSRRATENKSIVKKLKKEKQLLVKELVRRAKKGQIFYKPKGEYFPVC